MTESMDTDTLLDLRSSLIKFLSFVESELKEKGVDITTITIQSVE